MVQPWRDAEFYFQIRWPWGKMQCLEVIGLDPVQSGDDHGAAAYLASKMPGMRRPGMVLLKEVALSLTPVVRDWLIRAGQGEIQPASAAISLFFKKPGEAAEDRVPAVIWSLEGAFLLKAPPVPDGADGAVVTLAQLQVSHSGMTIIKS